MKYRTLGKTGEKVSALGFGCMRFPQKDGKIDRAEATKMLRSAIDAGVNYLDTAYVYQDGDSEAFLGEALKDGYREKVFLADKCPPWHVKEEGDFERILNTSLERLQTDYIDFYLLHALDAEGWETVKKFDLISKIREAKASGKVRHIGFSFHGDLALFKEIIDVYEGCEFCQIQFNYVDTQIQAGLAGLRYAAEKGLGVVIMEPVRGGVLAEPPAAVAQCLDKNISYARQALDFVWDFEEVSLLLSGMSTQSQVDENLAWASESAPHKLTEAQKAAYTAAAQAWKNSYLIPCTACGYCMPCPAGLDIPELYKYYNTAAQRKFHESKRYNEAEKKAPDCIGCGKCTNTCPQSIDGKAMMQKVAAWFE